MDREPSRPLSKKSRVPKVAVEAQRDALDEILAKRSNTRRPQPSSSSSLPPLNPRSSLPDLAPTADRIETQPPPAADSPSPALPLAVSTPPISPMDTTTDTGSPHFREASHDQSASQAAKPVVAPGSTVPAETAASAEHQKSPGNAEALNIAKNVPSRKDSVTPSPQTPKPTNDTQSTSGGPKVSQPLEKPSSVQGSRTPVEKKSLPKKSSSAREDVRGQSSKDVQPDVLPSSVFSTANGDRLESKTESGMDGITKAISADTVVPLSRAAKSSANPRRVRSPQNDVTASPRGRSTDSSQPSPRDPGLQGGTVKKPSTGEKPRQAKPKDAGRKDGTVKKLSTGEKPFQANSKDTGLKDTTGKKLRTGEKARSSNDKEASARKSRDLDDGKSSHNLDGLSERISRSVNVDGGVTNDEGIMKTSAKVVDRNESRRQDPGRVNQSTGESVYPIPNNISSEIVPANAANQPGNSQHVVKEQFRGCVRVISQMLRQNNTKRSIKRPDDVSESRNKLLKLILTRLRNMDDKLQKERSSSVKSNIPSVSSAPTSNNANADNASAPNSILRRTPGANKGLSDSRDRDDEKNVSGTRKSVEVDSEKMDDPTRAQISLPKISDQQRLAIVRESLYHVRELNRWFKKWSFDPKISMSELRVNLSKFSSQLSELRKLGNNADEYTEKEILAFLNGLGTAAPTITFLWDEVRIRLTMFKDNTSREKEISQNELMTMTQPLLHIVKWTSMLSQWVAMRWTKLCESQAESNKAKQLKLMFQTGLSDFYRPNGTSEDEMTSRFLGCLNEMLKGLKNRADDPSLPLRGIRKDILFYLEEGYKTLENACLEAWTVESDRRVGASNPRRGQSSGGESSGVARENGGGIDGYRSGSHKRKFGPGMDEARSDERESPASKRRAVGNSGNSHRGGRSSDDLARHIGGSSTERNNSHGDGRSGGEEVGRVARRQHGERNASEARNTSGAGAARAVQGGRSRGRADSAETERRLFERELQAGGRARQENAGPANRSSGEIGGRGQTGRAKRRQVSWADKLVTEEVQAPLGKYDVQTLFNDGYDLLGEESEVQRNAVTERAQQMGRGAVIALFGFLRSYVEALTVDIEGRRQNVRPDWVRLPYTPSAVRAMAKEAERRDAPR